MRVVERAGKKYRVGRVFEFVHVEKLLYEALVAAGMTEAQAKWLLVVRSIRLTYHDERVIKI